MELLAYAIIGGILYGIFFSLIGIGLNLIFGVMRIINLAHGQFIVLGGYAAWIISRHFGFNPLWGVPLSIVCAAVVGYPLYYAVVPRLQRSSDPEMLSFILFFGIGQMLEALTGLAFGADQRSLPGEALATGISVNRVSVIAFVAGLALAGTAGVFLPYLLGSVSPDLGNELTTTSFAIVIIGSLGNPLGTVIGGLVFGLGTMLMQTYYSSWSNLVPYVLLLIIVLIRPTGLLGKTVRNA